MARGNKVALGILVVCLLQAIAAGESRGESRDTNPLEAGNVIDGIVPRPGSVFPIGVDEPWFGFKDKVYEKIGLKFGFSYQMLFQSASHVAPEAAFDTALGHWTGFMIKWALLKKDTDFEGNLVFSMFDRRGLGNNAVPANFGIADVGGITTNVEFTTWSFEIENLYWEQRLRLGKNQFMVRIGK